MIEVNLETYEKVKKAEQAVIFFHKPNCSNCNTMKPIVEEWAKQNPNVKVFSYQCTAPDAVNQEFDIKMFPGIFSLKKGINHGGTNAVVGFHMIGVAFKDINERKITAYDTSRKIDGLQKRMNELKNIQFLNEFSITKDEELEEDKTAVEDDFVLKDPNAKEPEDCESCQ